MLPSGPARGSNLWGGVPSPENVRCHFAVERAGRGARATVRRKMSFGKSGLGLSLLQLQEDLLGHGLEGFKHTVARRSHRLEPRNIHGVERFL